MWKIYDLALSMRRIGLNLSFKNEIAYYSASKDYDLFYPKPIPAFWKLTADE